MATNDKPSIVLFVSEFAQLEPEGGVSLKGFDFTSLLGQYRTENPPRIFAITPSELKLLHDPSLVLVHSERKGWRWETETPEIYPTPPFLLSDRRFYPSRREVELNPTDKTRELILSEWSSGYDFVTPLRTEQWIGCLEISPPNMFSGRLIAFALEPTDIEGDYVQVILPVNKSIFGNVLIRK